MDSTLNSHNEDQAASYGDPNEKSELMKTIENLVHDQDWAYRDLLKEIFFGDTDYQA